MSARGSRHRSAGYDSLALVEFGVLNSPDSSIRFHR